MSRIDNGSRPDVGRYCTVDHRISFLGDATVGVMQVASILGRVPLRKHFVAFRQLAVRVFSRIFASRFSFNRLSCGTCGVCKLSPEVIWQGRVAV